jgi:adenylylsulfate kinase-like enzyme
VVEHHGEFIEVFVDTSVEECARRDTKGLYEKAKQGLIKNFTGVDDPYEAPGSPALSLDTSTLDVSTCTERILEVLAAYGVVP